MTRSSGEERLVYALAAYLGTSLLVTMLLLLFSLTAMTLLFAAARSALGPEAVYRLKPALYDSAGFALASAGTALAQYFLVSLLRRAVDEKMFLAVICGFTALFCGLLFWRTALFSSLGAYGLSGLIVTLAALLGGLEAVYQADTQNPWPPSVSSLFR
jgi:hypothetical protein